MLSYHHRNFFLLLAVSAGAVAILHTVAIFFYLYWQFPWLDIPVHGIAGFFVGLSVFAFLSYYGIFTITRTRRWLLAAIILASIVVGVLFEVFQLFWDPTLFREVFYFSDTLGDLLSDVVGSSTAWWFLVRQYAYLFA